MKANAKEILENVEMFIQRMETEKKRWGRALPCKISMVCEELSIFDWWNENLSLSQLKQMRSFLNTAIKLGYTGYVCFKVGAVGCSHGMWAYKKESENGYSPDGACLFHSFRSDENFWDAEDDNGKWLSSTRADGEWRSTLKQVKEFIGG